MSLCLFALSALCSISLAAIIQSQHLFSDRRAPHSQFSQAAGRSQPRRRASSMPRRLVQWGGRERGRGESHCPLRQEVCPHYAMAQKGREVDKGSDWSLKQLRENEDGKGIMGFKLSILGQAYIMRSYSQSFCEVARKGEFTLMCDVTKSLTIGPIDTLFTRRK